MTDALLVRPMLAAGQFIGRAVAWWLDELADMASRGSDRLFGRHAPDSAIHKARDAATVRLDPAQVFAMTLDLPRAAERSLAAVLRHQVARLVPLPPEQTCLGYRVLPRLPNAPILKVAVAVAKRAAVDQALTSARDIGLKPRRVVAHIAEAGPAPLVIWQEERSPGRPAPRRRLCRTLEIIAVTLALSAYALHVHRLDQVRDGLQDAVSQATREAAATRELGQRVAQSADALTFLRARRQEPAPVQVLDDLTTLLPLDTWLSDLTLRGSGVEIVGAAPRATDLVALIEGSAMFGHARFRSPITLLPDGRAERFDLTFDVKPGTPR